MISKFEIYLKEIIFGKRKGFIASFIKMILWPLSWFYCFVTICRNWVYDQGWMRRYVPPVPLVISIGNIVAGGTGKTPVTLLFAQIFYERFPLAILSRGYRSKAEKLDRPLILCSGQGPLYPAVYCGDEPYMFAQRLPKAHVIVGGDRQKASYLAFKAGVQIILLDDGMQHRKLARDFDVVVIDVEDPFGQGYFLPRGFLREDIRSLSRASLIILNHLSCLEQFEKVKDQIRQYTVAPMVGTNWRVASVLDLKGQCVETINEKKIGMFCGIAHPEYFRSTLEQMGATIVDEYWLSDHEKPEEKELERFSQICSKKGAEWLICTEKDRVKLKDMLGLAIPIAWLQMELQVVEGHQEWEKFLRQAEAKIS
jgi:tetraacyldisaccharide 4'-kinase